MFITAIAVVAVGYLALNHVVNKAGREMLHDLESYGYFASCRKAGEWLVYHAPTKQLTTMTRGQLMQLHVVVMQRGY